MDGSAPFVDVEAIRATVMKRRFDRMVVSIKVNVGTVGLDPFLVRFLPLVSTPTICTFPKTSLSSSLTG